MKKNYDISINPGYIIGEVELIDCVLISKDLDEELRRKDMIVYKRDHVGLYGWKLDNIKKYEKPIAAKGMLGLWNCEKYLSKE